MLLLAEFIVWIIGVAILVFWLLPAGAPPNIEWASEAPSNSQAQAHCTTKRSAFKAYRLTATTFLIVEVDDIYSEHPYIYAKIVPAANTILVLDTGCGGASNDPTVELTSLREFIETVDIEENGGKPLNEGGSRRYVVVLSHCHYDHICAYSYHIDTSASSCLHSGCRAIRRRLTDSRVRALTRFRRSQQSPKSLPLRQPRHPYSVFHTRARTAQSFSSINLRRGAGDDTSSHTWTHAR